MAIDTENKRRSVSFIFPYPDGTIGTADRAHATWFYSGLVYAEISLATGKITATITSRVPSATISSRAPSATISSRAPSATITGV